MGLYPRFDETMQKYVGYFGERAIPQINPTSLYSRLNKRDRMHFDASRSMHGLR